MKSLSYSQVSRDLRNIVQLVQNGEEVIIKDEHGQDGVAVIISYRKYLHQQERKLGILKGKASFTLADDYEASDEDFLAS